MANIDVSDLLLDHDFVSDISILRRTTAVNSYGQNTVSDGATVTTVGSIQPASFKQIQRLPEAVRIQDIRAFFVKTEILADSSGGYPDILIFNTVRYQILSVAPWGNFGAGWYEGICVAEKPSDA